MEGRTLTLRHTESKNGQVRKISLEGELWVLIERRWMARIYEGTTYLEFLQSFKMFCDFRTLMVTEKMKSSIATA